MFISKSAALSYLSSIRVQINAGGTPSHIATCNTGAILVSNRSTDVQIQAVETIKVIVTAQPTLV